MKKEKAAEKRKLIELGVLEKPVSKKAMRAERGGIKPFRARVVVDCAFDDKMTDKVRCTLWESRSAAALTRVGRSHRRK